MALLVAETATPTLKRTLDEIFRKDCLSALLFGCCCRRGLEPNFVNAFAKGSIEMNPRFNAAIAVFRCHHAVDRKRVSPGNQCVEHLGEVEKAQGVGRATGTVKVRVWS